MFHHCDCFQCRESNDGDGKFCFWRQHKFFKRLTQQNDHECVTSAAARGGVAPFPLSTSSPFPPLSSLSSCDRTNRQRQTENGWVGARWRGGKDILFHGSRQISRGKHVHCQLPLSVSLFARQPGHFHWTRPPGLPGQHRSPIAVRLYLSAYWRFEVVQFSRSWVAVLTPLFSRVLKINFERFSLAWNCLTSHLRFNESDFHLLCINRSSVYVKWCLRWVHSAYDWFNLTSMTKAKSTHDYNYIQLRMVDILSKFQLNWYSEFICSVTLFNYLKLIIGSRSVWMVFATTPLLFWGKQIKNHSRKPQKVQTFDIKTWFPAK